MSGTLLQSSITPSFGALSSGTIPPASGTSTTLPTDRLNAIDQALSGLYASQVDHDRLLVKQASNASALSDYIDLLDAKLETFADEISNNITVITVNLGQDL